MEKLTLLTARRPPKERDRFSTCSSVAAGRRAADGGVGPGATARGSARAPSAEQAVAEGPEQPVGRGRMMAMIAAPYTTPWMPGR